MKIVFLILIGLITILDVSKAQELFQPANLNRNSEIITYRLPTLQQSQEIVVEIVDGFAIFEGDIILFKEGIQKDAGIPGSNFRWRNGNIPYEIEAEHPRRATILQAIGRINQSTTLCMNPRNNENDFVEFIDGGGCASFVGRQSGRQEIIIGACSVGSIQHEILHTAGMFHEQSRLDRNTFVRINNQNIQQGREGNFRRVNNTISFCRYDFGSIMHYPATAFSTNGLPTITPINPLPSGVVMGQRNGLSQCDINGIANLYPNANNCNGGWEVVWNGSGNFQRIGGSGVALQNMRFGDFDGDDKTDVLTKTGNSIQVRYGKCIPFRQNCDWQTIGGTSVKLNDMRFGDFDGDDKTDILTKVGNSIRVRYGKCIPFRQNCDWQTIGGTSVKLNDMRFGDFDGDGKTDILTKVGNSIRVRYGKCIPFRWNCDWQTIGGTSIKLNDMRFGDFDGDGKTDILTKVGNSIWVRYGKCIPFRRNCDWQTIGGTSVKLNEMRFGDFDGDGKTDIFTKYGSLWRVRHGKCIPFRRACDWQTLGRQVFPLNDLRFGDFNGDGKTDVFRTNKNTNSLIITP